MTTPIDGLIFNDTEPTYYTSFDNKCLILDSYNSTRQDTLNADDMICQAMVIPAWVNDNNFVIPLSEKVYNLFLAELTAACSVMLNGVQSIEDERRRNRAVSRLRLEAVSTELNIIPTVNFGRKGNGRS